MKKTYMFLIALFACCLVSGQVSGQTFLTSISGAGDTSVMTDLQQPDTLIVSGFGAGALPAPSWPNYCAPVSAANIWEFYDNRDTSNIAPWGGSLPQPGPAFGWGVSWSTSTIQGQGTTPANPPVYMNTNGIVGGPWAGTNIQDIYAGVIAYATSTETANALTKTSYTVSPLLDEVQAYVPPAPGSVQIVDETASFANYQVNIPNDIPAIICFKYWIAQPPITTQNQIEYYNFAVGPQSGDTGEGVIEQWQTEMGHAVTGVGFHLNFDPGDGGGARDWYVVRDNWMSTGVEVAVPFGDPSSPWNATIHLDTPEENIIDETGEIDPKVTRLDFAVDLDNGVPFGLAGSDVAIEDAADACQDDFYQWPVPQPPPLYNLETIDEGIPGLQMQTGAGIITDALCFGSESLDLEVSESMHDGMGFFFWVQFTVNPDSSGLQGTAVSTEAAKQPSEEGGDVFESAGGNTNILLADETPLGLEDAPENDINALVMNEPFPPDVYDTDGDAAPDTPHVFYSVKNSPGLPSDPNSDDIAVTGPAGSYPALWKTAMEIGLMGGGVPNQDNLDALFIDASGDVFFSLQRGSPMLSGAPGSAGPIINWFTGAPGVGADPGDIIAVFPGAGGPPAMAPMVVITAAMLGLQGDGIANPGSGEDDLNGLHISPEQVPVLNWEIY